MYFWLRTFSANDTDTATHYLIGTSMTPSSGSAHCSYLCLSASFHLPAPCLFLCDSGVRAHFCLSSARVAAPTPPKSFVFL
ncbi:hypothetical protein SCLCIDRAFT_690371 [Scleroderma citrinum Foug A]|uniref:Uncharacterized protein n=1 Tax=Scleroderma citrinum Foug A TaxID=1036808 RepID=A0A0C3E5R3_9AGAM|nr:hypothetical protein SCLCIDRAFT_690371 [Scleroderma citrinum Foug A]